MATGVVCRVYNRSVSIARLTLPEFCLSDTIDNLKLEISKQTKISAEELQIIHLGTLLDDSETLESCGVKPGVTLHAIRKPEREPQSMITSPDKMDAGEVVLQSLALALKAAVRNPAYRNTVRRISKPDVLENIVAATPGLANDPIAIAILQDPDLLAQFTDSAAIQRVVESHPALVEAINHVVAAVQEEGGVLGAGTASSGRLPRFLNLFWDAETDDDEFPSHSEQASSSDASRTPSQQDNSLFPAITPAQLASALAAVATAGSTTPVSSSSETPGPSSRIVPSTSTGTPTQSASIITSELFSQAVQQAMSATTQSRLQQLRDMGITNDGASLRALAITNGDVQAALELIFGEGLNDDGND